MDRRKEKEEEKKEKMEMGDLKGQLGLALWFGIAAMILYGFLAVFMSDIFSSISTEYNTTIQLILMFGIPFLGIMIIYNIFSGGQQRR